MGHRLVSAALMSGPGTGTASAERTTLRAARAASSATLSRTSLLSVVDLMGTCQGPGALASAPPARGVVLAVAGNLVTGFAAGLAATSTTSLAGWSASDAMHLETLALRSKEIACQDIKRRNEHEISNDDDDNSSNLKLLLVLPPAPNFISF